MIDRLAPPVLPNPKNPEATALQRALSTFFNQLVAQFNKGADLVNDELPLNPERYLADLGGVISTHSESILSLVQPAIDAVAASGASALDSAVTGVNPRLDALEKEVVGIKSKLTSAILEGVGPQLISATHIPITHRIHVIDNAVATDIMFFDFPLKGLKDEFYGPFFLVCPYATGFNAANVAPGVNTHISPGFTTGTGAMRTFVRSHTGNWKASSA